MRLYAYAYVWMSTVRLWHNCVCLAKPVRFCHGLSGCNRQMCLIAILCCRPEAAAGHGMCAAARRLQSRQGSCKDANLLVTVLEVRRAAKHIVRLHLHCVPHHIYNQQPALVTFNNEQQTERRFAAPYSMHLHSGRTEAIERNSDHSSLHGR